MKKCERHTNSELFVIQHSYGNSPLYFKVGKQQEDTGQLINSSFNR